MDLKLDLDRSAEPVCLPPKLFEDVVTHERPADLIALYAMLVYLQKHPEIIRQLSGISNTAIGKMLGWASDKVADRRKALRLRGWISNVRIHDLNGYVESHIIRIHPSPLSDRARQPVDVYQNADRPLVLMTPEQLEAQKLSLWVQKNLPAAFHNHEGFLKAVGRWFKYRREIKKPLTFRGFEIHCETLKAHSPEVGIKLINKAINSGWRGIFEDRKLIEKSAQVSDKVLNPEKEFNEMEMLVWKAWVTVKRNEILTEYRRMLIMDLVEDMRAVYTKVEALVSQQKSYSLFASFLPSARSFIRDYSKFIIGQKWLTGFDISILKVDSKLWSKFIYHEESDTGFNFHTGRRTELGKEHK